MPWSVVDNHPECPESESWGVVNDDTGQLEACHATESDAEDHVAALYANAPENDGRKTMSDRQTRLLEVPERRSLSIDDFEMRRDGDDLTLTGYAATFEQPYEVFGGPERGGWMEVVDRRAFDTTLREKPDVHLLANHEGLSMARTKSGTLRLSTDRTGLRVSASLDRSNPRVQELESGMRRRDLDEMSFAFRTVRHSWSEDETERRLDEVSIHKGDVSVVNNGANDTTSANLRNLVPALDFLGDLNVQDALVEVRALDDPRERIEAARDVLGRLLRETVPPEKRTLSVAEALELAGTTNENTT